MLWAAVDDGSALDSELLECVVLLDAVMLVWMVGWRLVVDSWVVDGMGVVAVFVAAFVV